MRTGARLVLGILVGAATLADAAPTPKKQTVADLAAPIAALSDVDPEVAVRAAEALGASDLAPAHEALLDGLAFGMPPAVAVATIAALQAHPAPPDVAALRRYAAHHNPTVRVAAIAALAMYPSPEAHAAVIAGLHDTTSTVRSSAAEAAARGRIRAAIDPLFELLARNEDAAAKALSDLADPPLAAKIADHLGQVPDPILAATLGMILRRRDFGPDPARVEVVRALGKISDRAATTALGDYVDSVPKNPPRPSRAEAEKMLEARGGGGK